MKKMHFNLLGQLLFVLITLPVIAQKTIDDPFFDMVDYIGAFGDQDWTDGWSNWTPQTEDYPAVTDVIEAGDITTNTVLTADKVYLLDGWVYVKAGVILTIEPGTIIRGSKANKGALIIEKGARILAEGTSDNPIVFTSNQDAGSRGYGDWGGVIILGNALVNKIDPIIEGGPTSTYGGNSDTDTSGIIKYVRIEFPGIAFQPDKEINGLTFGGVGSGTEVEYIQVSFSGDDSYELFGGTVNAKHLIAYRGWDDDFDTDYGYRGMVQFGVSLRDPDVADPGSGSNTFESDNDGTGTDQTPITQPLFSNFSAFGPLVSTGTSVNSNYKRAMHLRRNTKLNLYNSILAGYVTGLFIEGTATQANATAGDLRIMHTYLAGAEDFYGDAFDSAYFVTAEYKNMALAENSDLQIADPFNLEDPDFLPMEGSPVLTASSWADTLQTGLNPAIEANMVFASVYPNPFTISGILRVELETASVLSVKLYDITGTLITTVVNERRSAGRHEFTFHLPQKGIYFADIQLQDKRQVLKIVNH